MSTSLKLEELSPDVQSLIRRMHERDECIVVNDEEGPIAYFNLAFRPDINPKQRKDHDFSGVPLEKPVREIVYDKRTGSPAVAARFGARMVTAEEIYEELRSGFP